MCEITVKLAHLWNVPLFTWTCPLVSTLFIPFFIRSRIPSPSFQKDSEEKQLSSVVRLSPSLPAIARALAEMLTHLRWETVAIVATGESLFYFSNAPLPTAQLTDREPWTSLERALFHSLQTVGIAVRRRVLLPRRASFQQIRKILRALCNVSRRGQSLFHFHVCKLPFVNRRYASVTLLCLPTSDDDQLMTRVLSEMDVVHSVWNSMTLIVHTKDDDLFLPTGNASSAANLADRMEEAETTRRFLPPRNLTSAFLQTLMTITPLDYRYASPTCAKQTLID